MTQDQRHCLPNRVRAMLGILSDETACDQALPPLIEDGRRCAERGECELAHACEGIHRAFAPPGCPRA